MIIRIFAANILSFDKKVEFSLIPGKGSRKANHIARTEKRDDIPTLKTGVLYGANASGKSNLIKIVHILQAIATKNYLSHQEIPVEPFKLGDTVGGDSEIEIEIKIGNNHYAYGVKFNKKTITEEWLYAINKRGEKKIFERKASENGTIVDFGSIKFKNKEDKQFANFVGRGTPENESFLKECSERNVNFIQPINEVFEWFDEKLKVFFPSTRTKGLEFQLDKNKDLSAAMSKFLNYFKTGIFELVAKEINVEEIKEIPANWLREITGEMEPEIRTVIGINNKSYILEKDQEGNVKAFKLYTTRLNKEGKSVDFEIGEESDGTRRIIDFIPILVDLLENDSVYLIDEIDRSMHPILTKGIMEYYLSNVSNINSQLIVTTHESNLLDLDLLRKDEIWFVEKNKGGASNLYSLLEFKPRADKDIRKGYLNGRFGAIPFLTDPKDLNW